MGVALISQWGSDELHSRRSDLHGRAAFRSWKTWVRVGAPGFGATNGRVSCTGSCVARGKTSCPEEQAAGGWKGGRERERERRAIRTPKVGTSGYLLRGVRA